MSFAEMLQFKLGEHLTEDVNNININNNFKFNFIFIKNR